MIIALLLNQWLTIDQWLKQLVHGNTDNLKDK